jgi:hypothetical protein
VHDRAAGVDGPVESRTMDLPPRNRARPTPRRGPRTAPPANRPGLRKALWLAGLCIVVFESSELVLVSETSLDWLQAAALLARADGIPHPGPVRPGALPAQTLPGTHLAVG